MAKIDEDSRGLPISETLFLGSCSSCLHSQKCKCFFSACAVISAFSRWIVAWILHLHACFNPHWCKETMIWYGLTNDACNPAAGIVSFLRQSSFDSTGTLHTLQTPNMTPTKWQCSPGIFQIWSNLQIVSSSTLTAVASFTPVPHSNMTKSSAMLILTCHVFFFPTPFWQSSHRYLHTISPPILWCPGHTGEGHIYIGWHKRQFSAGWRSGAQKPCWPDQNWVL